METFKSIISGDTITARRVGGTAFEFKPIAQHIFSTNRLPTLPETGLAIERRLAAVHFPNFVPETKRNPYLADELFEQGGAGLLRRAVEGFQRVLRRGYLAQPAPVRLATLSWIHRSNPIRVFAELCLTATGDPKDRISAREMRRRCDEFCKRRGLTPPSSDADLKKNLAPFGFTSKKSNTMQWVGVRFVE